MKNCWLELVPKMMRMLDFLNSLMLMTLCLDGFLQMHVEIGWVTCFAQIAVLSTLAHKAFGCKRMWANQLRICRVSHPCISSVTCEIFFFGMDAAIDNVL